MTLEKMNYRYLLHSIMIIFFIHNEVTPAAELLPNDYSDDKSELLHYDYYDDEAVTVSAETDLKYENVTLKKCDCNSTSYLREGNCYTSVTSLYVQDFMGNLLETTNFTDVTVTKDICSENETLTEINTGRLVVRDGTLLELVDGGLFKNYCVENVMQDGTISMVSRVCVPKILQVPRCCEEAHVLTNHTCVKEKFIESFPFPIKLGLTILSDVNITHSLQEIPKTLNIDNVTMHPNESNNQLFYLKGRVVIINGEDRFPIGLSPYQYCINLIKYANGGTDYAAFIWNTEEDKSSGILIEPVDDSCDIVMYWVSLPLLLISVVFLICILILLNILREERNKVGSKNIMCHVGALLGGFFLLLVSYIPQNHICKLYGPLIQFFFLAAFFWLNVMCFDLWWKISCLSTVGEPSRKSNEKRFLLYSCYAWGTPILVGAITITLDNLPSHIKENINIILPGFGEAEHCWFADHQATFVYYFGIIAVLMVMNLFFFLWVFLILLNNNCNYNATLNNEPRERKRTWVYLKIFCVMGGTWLFEFISWQEGSCYVWIIWDIINCLRGLMLFIIFFGNKKSITKIRERVTILNSNFNSQISKSVNNLRRFSKFSITAETGIESTRTSEVAVNLELSNRVSSQQRETSENYASQKQEKEGFDEANNFSEVEKENSKKNISENLDSDKEDNEQQIKAEKENKPVKFYI